MLQLDAQLCRLSDIFSCHLAYCRFHLAVFFFLFPLSFLVPKKAIWALLWLFMQIKFQLLCVCVCVGVLVLVKYFSWRNGKCLQLANSCRQKRLTSARNTCVNTNANSQKIQLNFNCTNCAILMRINCVAAFANEIIISSSSSSRMYPKKIAKKGEIYYLMRICFCVTNCVWQPPQHWALFTTTQPPQAPTTDHSTTKLHMLLISIKQPSIAAILH